MILRVSHKVGTATTAIPAVRPAPIAKKYDATALSTGHQLPNFFCPAPGGRRSKSERYQLDPGAAGHRKSEHYHHLTASLTAKYIRMIDLTSHRIASTMIPAMMLFTTACIDGGK